METPSGKGLRVVIAGGGIAGLTLANALQHANIDYVVLEKRLEIATQLGASIGIAPNVWRILDLLGCYEELQRLTEPVQSAGSHRANGDDIFPSYSDFVVSFSMGYPIAFLDRKQLLQALANQIKDWGVLVHCIDGSQYEGDIIVGADGVNSLILWREADSVDPGRISQREQKSMIAEYSCCFGISAPHPLLPAGCYEVTYHEDVSMMVTTGKGGRIFWFLFSRMDRVYQADRRPRFSPDDAEALAHRNGTLGVLPGGKITFGDLWRAKENFHLVALEEGILNTGPGADSRVWATASIK